MAATEKTRPSGFHEWTKKYSLRAKRISRPSYIYLAHCVAQGNGQG